MRKYVLVDLISMELSAPRTVMASNTLCRSKKRIGSGSLSLTDDTNYNSVAFSTEPSDNATVLPPLNAHTRRSVLHR